jgi:hypothetical protein
MIKRYIRVGWIGQKAFNEYGTYFVQQNRGPKIGVIVALDKERIGWSLISEKEDLSETLEEKKVIETPKGKKTITVKTPIWNSKRIWDYGTRLAVERANGEQPVPKIIPKVVQRELEFFKKKIDKLERPF